MYMKSVQTEVTSYTVSHAMHKDLDLTLCRGIKGFKQERDVTSFAFGRTSLWQHTSGWIERGQT